MTDPAAGVSGRRKSLIPVGIGLLLVLLATGLLATVPGTLTEARAYVAAPACLPETRSATCTTTVPATVRGTENEPRGKGTRYWILLTEEGSDTVRRVQMIGHEPVQDTVHAGDQVTVTYWRGEIRTVRFGTAAQETKASPADDWRIPVAFGLMTLCFGLSMLLLAWWAVRHRKAAHFIPWQPGILLVTGILVGGTGFVAGRGAGTVREAFVITALSVVPAAVLGALFTWWLRRRQNRAADTSGIVPVLPDRKQCLHATVRGDVPYSVSGFGLLVVGDGRPAATPDPEGRFARRTLPETLTVQHVRALRPDDPDGWYEAYKYDGVVMECRDGDRTVLIATRRRDAPLVLGSLTGMPTVAGTVAEDPADHQRTP